MQRPDGRTKGAMRPVKITTDYTMYAEGSVLVEMGNTKVICTASVEEKVTAVPRGQGPRLGNRRVCDAPACDQYPQKNATSSRSSWTAARVRSSV